VHERPGDGPKRPEKAIPAPVGGSMDNKNIDTAVYPGKPYPLTPETHDTFMDPHGGGETTYDQLADKMDTPPASETQKHYPGEPTMKNDTYMDPYNNAFWEGYEADLIEKTAGKTKTVGGQHLTADKFACVGNLQQTETWKLPIHDAAHVRNALARYNQTDGCQTPAVRAKILRAAKKFGIDASGFETKHKQAYYQDNVKKETKNDSFMDPGPIGTTDPVVTDKTSTPALPTGDPQVKTSEKIDEDQPGATKADVEKEDYAHPKPDVDTRKVERAGVPYTHPMTGNDMMKTPPTILSNGGDEDDVKKGGDERRRQTPDGNVDESDYMGPPPSVSDNYPPGNAIPPRTAETKADPAGAAPPAPIKHDSFMDVPKMKPIEDPRIVKNDKADFKDNLKDKKDLKDSKTAEGIPAGDDRDINKVSTEVPQMVKNPAPTKKITDDQAKKARKQAIAKMQTHLKPSDNFLAPKKKGNVDLLPNMGLDEEKPNYSQPTFKPHKDSEDMQKDDRTSVSAHDGTVIRSQKKLVTVITAAGVPTTRTPAGDNINDHYVELTDKDGAPIRTVPSAEQLSTQYGVITPRVRTDENRTVVVKEGDSFQGDGDKPGDSTTRGPDADRIDTNKTVVIKDVTKEQNDLENRKVVGRMAINILRFAKSFWKSTDGVLAFLVNEGFWNGYKVDEAGRIVNNIRETGAYYEVDALPAENFVPGSFVEHCIASFGGDCAIVAVSGEVKTTPEPQHLPYGVKVNQIAKPGAVTKAYHEYHIQRVADLEADLYNTNDELAQLKARLGETESLLATALKEKSRIANDLLAMKSELNEKVAEARLSARLEDLPEVVKAQLRTNSRKDEIIQFLREAKDAEWDLVHRTFALAKHKSFAELSKEEGKLPVGGGSTNETKSLKEYLR
jgi:hypothetical protein